MSTKRIVGLIAGVGMTVALTAGCGGSDDPTDEGSGSSTPSDQSSSGSSRPDESSSPLNSFASGLSASITWPQGTDDFLDITCTSGGPNTIFGAASNTDWELAFDGNILEEGDTGTLTMANTSDRAIEYSADITEVNVNEDGSFRVSGADVGDQAFSLTGTCDISWP